MRGGAKIETQWYCWSAVSMYANIRETLSGTEKRTPPAKGILNTH